MSGFATANRRIALLDIAERVIVFIFYGIMTYTFLFRWLNANDMADIIVSSLLLISEGTVVVFIIIRRSSYQISLKLSDWILAVCGTSAPLLARPGGEAWVPAAFCGAMMVAGIVLQVSAKLTLRRSFGLIPANRGVKIGGPYRFIRHPMYAGYALTHLFFFLSHPTIWNATIYTAEAIFQIYRLLAEEKYLGRDENYRRFMSSVRFRVIPYVF